MRKIDPDLVKYIHKFREIHPEILQSIFAHLGIERTLEIFQHALELQAFKQENL